MAGTRDRTVARRGVDTEARACFNGGMNTHPAPIPPHSHPLTFEQLLGLEPGERFGFDLVPDGGDYPHQGTGTIRFSSGIDDTICINTDDGYVLGFGAADLQAAWEIVDEEDV